MLLARDGHDVVVLERDPLLPPADPRDAWELWQRPGVNQFRLPHSFLSRFRSVLDTELPQISAALEAGGALRQNLIRDVLPAVLTGRWRDGDERYELLTGRRPIVEAVLAAQAESMPDIEVRRGVTVTGLVEGASALPGIPHVIGVRTRAGEIVLADLVVDMTGRRSALPDWLQAIGARRPSEELEDSGFMYYGRHFQSGDGSLPAIRGGAVIHWGTITSLTLAADNGTWAIGIVTGSKDQALRPMREPARWEAVVRSLPLVGHWLDGTPIEEGVKVMARLEDRYRGFVIDGMPVVTGVIAVADAWACSNPANGRGASIGMLHALTLREELRTVGVDDPAAFASAFHKATAEAVEPWYRATLAGDRHRLAQVESGIGGGNYDPDDVGYQMQMALTSASRQDPDCLRAALDIVLVLRTPAEVFASAGLREKVLQLGSNWRDDQAREPTREQLLALMSA
jgi:2-polyprenyl-6-methoxyphenol hydroxylase-like FAD-dependent oxidoreductase